jgi:hypothetical protein
VDAVDEAQIHRLWEAFFNERDPGKLRDTVGKLNQMLQERTKSLEDQPPLKQDKELVYERASAVLIFELLPPPNTHKSGGYA